MLVNSLQKCRNNLFLKKRISSQTNKLKKTLIELYKCVLMETSEPVWLNRLDLSVLLKVLLSSSDFNKCLLWKFNKASRLARSVGQY